MEIIKKNLISVICGVVALLSIAAAFWPIDGMFASIQESLDASEKKSLEAQRLYNEGTTGMKQPLFDDKNLEAPPLNSFPTEENYKQAIAKVEKQRQSSKALMDAAKAKNQHQVISNNCLPSWVNTSTAFQALQRNYRARLTGLVQALNAADVPTTEILQAEADRRWKIRYASIPKINNVPDANSLAEEQNDFTLKELPTIKDKVLAEYAGKTMYLSSTGLAYCDGLPQTLGAPPTLGQVWWAHNTLWIQEDIVGAIIETNKALGGVDDLKKLTVANAPVKRLVQTTIRPEYLTDKGLISYAAPATDGFGGLGGFDAMSPMVVATGETTDAGPSTSGDIVKVFKDSFTGRVSNSIYDVVRFRFTVDVDARYGRELLARLIDGRFITITNVKLVGLDREHAQNCGLVYGSHPVMQMTVEAEAAFFRDWTQKLMPEEVKKKLNIQEAVAP